MKKILVTGANGDISDAAGRILKEAYPGAELHGADAAGAWPGQGLFCVVHPLPKARDPGFIPTFLELARGFDLILPMPEPELLALAEAWDEVRELPLLMNRPEVVRCFCDKEQAGRWFARHDLPAPETRLLSQAEELPLPLFAKPRFGYGSRQLFRLDKAEERRRAMAELPGEAFVVQRYLSDDLGEFTCAVVAVGQDVRAIVLKRQLQGGMTSQATVECHPAIEALLEQVARCVGAPCFLNVQLRLTTEGPFIFEINPRFSSTVRMRHLVGFRDLVWMVEARHGTPLPEFRPVAGSRVFRLSRELVVPP